LIKVSCVDHISCILYVIWCRYSADNILVQLDNNGN